MTDGSAPAAQETPTTWGDIMGEPHMTNEALREIADASPLQEEAAEDRAGASIDYFDVPTEAPAEPVTEPEPVIEAETPDPVVEAPEPVLRDAPEADDAPVVEPEEELASTDAGYSITEEDFDQILSSPEALAEVLTLHGRHVKAAVLKELREGMNEVIQPQVLEQSRMASALFHLELTYDTLDTNVLLVALGQATKNNPGASLGALVRATKEDIEKNLPEARAAAASKQRHDLRSGGGQFRATVPGARTDRAGSIAPKGDPTVDAMNEMRRLNTN